MLKMLFRKIANIFRKIFINMKCKKVKIGSNLMLSTGTEVCVNKNADLCLGDNIYSDGTCRIIVSNGAYLKIGNDCYFNMNVFIGSNNEINIGNHCIFGPGVVVTDNDHKFNKNSGISCNQYNNGTISIGNECWFGANSVILKNTHIGDGCVIGAGCIIKGEIPSNSIITNNQNLHIHQIEDK